MTLFTSPVVRAADANNNSLSGAKWYFYQTLTTTPAATYTTSARNVAHANPVVADAGGLFPPIYLDPEITYRAWLKTAAGVTVQDIDPYLTATGADISLEQNVAGAVTRTLEDFYQQIVSIEDFGASTSNNQATNTTAINAAIAALEGGARRTALYFPPKAYACGILTITDGNLDLLMHGCTLHGTDARISTTITCSDVRVYGGHVIDTTGSGPHAAYLFDLNGSDLQFIGTVFEKDPADFGGYTGYIRSDTDSIRFIGCQFLNSNGVYIQGANHTFSDFLMEAPDPPGGDDGFALKATTGYTENINIGPGLMRNYAAGLAIGSEVGVRRDDDDADANGNDPTFSRGVRNVNFHDVTMEACSHLALIKPGAIYDNSLNNDSLGYDYRDGTVEDIRIDNNTLTDRTGLKFMAGISIRPGRGARVRRVYGEGNLINARANDDGTNGTTVGTVGIFIIDYSALHPTINAPSVSDVNVGIRYNDPHDGAAAGGAGISGNPVQYIARATKQTTTHGTLSRIAFDLEGNGSKEAGIIVGDNNDGAVEVRRAELRNVSKNPVSAVQGGIYSLSNIKLGQLNIDATSGQPVGSTSGLTDTAYTASVAIVPIGSYTAGTTADKTIWAMPAKGYIHSVAFINSATLATDATNYTTLTLIAGTGATPFVTLATNVTGFTGDTAVNAHSGSSIANSLAFSIAKDTAIRFLKAETGTGAAVTDLVAIIRYVVHG